MRIVSLLPSSTEIVFALGLEDSLVGVTHECDFPSAALQLPKLTRNRIIDDVRADETRAASIHRQVEASVHDGHALYEIDEALLAELRPDLILTQELCDVCAVSSSLLQRALAKSGSTPAILSQQPTSLEGVYDTIVEIGAATGTVQRAHDVVEGLRRRAAALQARTRGTYAPRTLILEWTDPPMGSGHWTPTLVEIAGGKPVLGWRGEYSRVISWDDILAADPECIIVVPCGMDLEAAHACIADLERTCKPWAALVAGPHRRVVAMDGNQFANRPGPRLIETAERFAAAIHPQLAPLHGSR